MSDCECGCGVEVKCRFVSGHNQRGKSPWNDGLTKDNDSRVAASAKISGRPGPRSSAQLAHLKELENSLRGIPKSLSARQKTAATLRGRKLPLAHKNNIAVGMLGHQNTLGLVETEEHKQKIREKLQKSWDGVTPILGMPCYNNQITETKFWAFIEKQHNCCWMCNKSLREGGIIVVDHNHATGKIRGIVHNICNLHFKE